MGHYRRVNQHVWNLWCRTYGSSGPAITVVRITDGGSRPSTHATFNNMALS
ncbi:unnamed protein product [Ascophyllum nodosum]